MKLVADLGNTHCKVALYQHNQVVELHRWEKSEASRQLDRLLQVEKNIDQAILSSVLDPEVDFAQLLQQKLPTLYLNHTTPIPIHNAYATPETLGKDRLCNAVAAAMEFENDNVLSIDFGTCIKYDFVDQQKKYWGGAIAPGLTMRYQAMADQTDLLPLLNKTENTPLVGANTENSMASGVMNGIVFEINGAIEAYSEKFENIKVVFTGGDHIHFVNGVKNDIFARPNLTLNGLYQILNFNEAL